MKSYLLLLSPLLSVLSVRAQDLRGAGRQDSAIKVIALRSGRYAHTVYTINNEPLTSATLTAILKHYPKSAAELRKERGPKRLAILLIPVFLAGTIVGGIQADKHKDEAGSAFSRAPVPFSIGLGAFVSSLILVVASDHYEKAIEVYNSQFH